MIQFLALVMLQFAIVLVIGLPIGLLLFRRTLQTREAIGWIALTPAIGVTIYLAFGATLHLAGMGGEKVFCLLLLLSLWMLATFQRTDIKPALASIGLALVAGAIAVYFNSADLAFAGLDYFPLTNDDTFSYLGLVDQIREAGWIKPTISYPAGFHPIIVPSVDVRAPGAIFIADLAQALHLETHTAFFVTQRMFLPVTAVAATGVVLLVTGSRWGACLCLASLIFGNTLLNQMLQQFNSCSMGTIVGTVVVAMLIWSGRHERSLPETIFGSFVAGFAVGTMAITSVEAHPFYLGISGLIFLSALYRSNRRMDFWKFAIAFLFGYVVPSGFFLVKIWLVVWTQYSLANLMPAQSVAVPGFLIFLSGVSVDIPAELFRYLAIPVAVAIGSVVSSLAAAAFLLWRSCATVASRLRNHDALVLGIFSATVFALEEFLYERGIGYGLLKIAEYFAFLNAITVIVVAVQLAELEKRLGYTAMSLVVLFCIVADNRKSSLLSIYRDATMHGPTTVAYLDLSKSDIDTSKLGMEQFNLYLYENRMKPSKIYIPPERSARFAPD